MKELLLKIWNGLTEPGARVQEDTKRTEARFFLTFLLLVTPISIFGIITIILLNPEHFLANSALILTVLSGMFLYTGVFVFSRFMSHNTVVALTMSIGLLTILTAALLSNPPHNQISLYYSLIIIFVSGVFLSLKYTVVITAVSLSVLLITPLLVSDLTLYDVLIGPFYLVLSGAAATLLVAHYRNQIEQKRQQEVSDLLKTAQQRADQLIASNDTLLDIVSHRDINELLEAITERAANLLGMAGSSIYLADGNEQTLTLTAVHGPGKELLGSTLQRGEGLAGRVLTTGQPLSIEDYSTYSNRSSTIPPNLLGSVIQVPIILGHKVIGVISCQEQGGVTRPFTENDKNMLLDLAQQSALALQNAYLFKEEQTARDRAERLQAATQALSSSLILHNVLDTILEELQKVIPYDSASVQQIKEEKFLEIIGGRGFANVEKLLGIRFDLASENNPNQQVIETRAPVIMADVPKLYNRFKEPPFDETPIHSWLGVPLLFGEQIIGMLALDKQEINYFTQEHARLLSAFAAQAAVAIENARLYEETHLRAFELETLADISASLRVAQTVSEMLPILLEKTVKAINASYSVLFLVDAETNELVSRYSVPEGFFKIGIRRQPDKGITGYVSTSREIHISNDLANDPLHFPIPEEADSFEKIASAISLPLQVQEHLLGVMHIGSDKKRQFTEVDVRLLTAVSNIAANALNRASVMDTLEEHVNARTQELADANARLQELDKLKTKFISDISHELRTPVATLNLYMDLLDRGKEANKAKYMDVLRQKTDLLVRLTEDILNISRLNLYEGSLEFTAVNLNDTTAIVIAMNQERAQAAELHLVFQPAPNLPDIHAERNQLLQAINNVLTNALDFTLKGSITVRTFTTNNQSVCLEIKDTGIGIPADELPHIFERFYRGQNIAQLNIPGTGLGLTIVKEIVDLHKGKIEVKSSPGQGSTFRLLWPVAKNTIPKTGPLRKD